MSKRDIRAGGRSIWSAIGASSSNLPYLGLAAASMEHLHWSVAVIPAFATEILWDSIASCREDLS